MNENTNNNARTNALGEKIIYLLTTVVCAVILVVTFFAFRNIENITHALIVLFSGILLDVIIFFNGSVKEHKQ